MPRKLTKEKLTSFGVLNPDDYVGSHEKNLNFKCEDCGDIYTMSIANRKQQIKKGYNTCKKCSQKIIGERYKTSKEELNKVGCLNPDDFEKTNTVNLKFKCERCDDIYTTSLVSRQRQIKNGHHTCSSCSKKINVTNDSLTSIGCLNPNDYKSIKTQNLKFKCVECGEIYTMSLGGRRQQINKNGLNTCKTCSKKSTSIKLKKSVDELTAFGVLNTDEYVNAHTSNLKFRCSDCGGVYITSFASRRQQLKKGYHTCKPCAMKNNGLNKRVSKEELISFGVLNPNDYDDIKTSNLQFKCSSCNNIIKDRSLQEYLRGFNKCSLCANTISKPEIELIDFLKEIGIKEEEIKSQARVLKREGKRPLELDIYLQSYNFAIEFHGDKWHSVWHKHSKDGDIIEKPHMKTLHHEKYLLAKEQGIRLIQIHEHEWNNPSLKEKLKGLIKHTLGKSTYKEKIYARNCIVRRIDKRIANLFLNKYHLQGTANQGTVDLGLFYQDELVAVTSFITSSLSKRHKGKHELIRHATNTNYLIIGALGKTLSHYKKNHHDKVYTFCDVEKFNGTSYIKAGFKETYFSEPQYYYVVDGIKYHKRLLQRQKIANKFPEFEFKTYGESSMLKELINEGYRIFKIYDAGKICFESL